MTSHQPTLFDDLLMREPFSPGSAESFCAVNVRHPFPPTRYQGSKAKIIDWIWTNVRDIPCRRVLDAFGGTGVISHLFKRMGKEVWYNDLLAFNTLIGKALIENDTVLLDEKTMETVLSDVPGRDYPTFIQERFDGIFYLPEENRWLDRTIENIRHILNEYQQAIAWFALFQSAIIKRPYNLFHRANLSVRTRDVKRNFGNKTTWDGSFDDYFRKFVRQANRAVFSNGQCCHSLCLDVMDIPTKPKFDLVYLDPPYLSDRNIGTDYLDFYHFLEGMVDYSNWNNRILDQYRHLPLSGKGESDWTNQDRILPALENAIHKFRNAVLVLSYRSDGIPSERQLTELLKGYKKDVVSINRKTYRYVLSNKVSSELLLVAQ